MPRAVKVSAPLLNVITFDSGTFGSLGPVAPFVGHNAFLRWEALQECMSIDPDDGFNKIWSEDHVSEDFQIAITLQCKVSRSTQFTDFCKAIS